MASRATRVQGQPKCPSPVDRRRYRPRGMRFSRHLHAAVFQARQGQRQGVRLEPEFTQRSCGRQLRRCHGPVPVNRTAPRSAAVKALVGELPNLKFPDGKALLKMIRQKTGLDLRELAEPSNSPTWVSKCLPMPKARRNCRASPRIPGLPARPCAKRCASRSQRFSAYRPRRFRAASPQGARPKRQSDVDVLAQWRAPHGLLSAASRNSKEPRKAREWNAGLQPALVERQLKAGYKSALEKNSPARGSTDLAGFRTSDLAAAQRRSHTCLPRGHLHILPPL